MSIFCSPNQQVKSGIFYLHTDKLFAIPAIDGGFDDLGMRDEHIQMRDRKQGETDTEEIENGLSKKSVKSIRKKNSDLLVSGL